MVGARKPLARAATGLAAALIGIGAVAGQRAEAQVRGGGAGLSEVLTAQDQRLREQEQRLAEQTRMLEEQRRALAEQQRALEELRRQLERAAGTPPPTEVAEAPGPVGPFEAVPVPQSEAAEIRGGQVGGAGTLEVRPPQQFFGRVRGEAVPVPPERLEQIGPGFEGEPPIPVFVPQDKREEFLRLRERMRELVVPGPQEAAPPERPETAAVPPAEEQVAPAPPAAPAVPEAPEEAPRAQPPQQVAVIEEERPDIVAEVLADTGGVLTPAGVLVVEPSFEYTNNSSNRFNFSGIEVVGILFGAIEARQVERDIITTAATLRYGVTNRLEVDAKIPFVYRRDEDRSQILGQEVIAGDNINNSGLGDIEFGAHYQLTGSPPFLIGNLRVKSDTGDGPFDVSRDANGIETESPTGSGFWSIEPSLTAIYPVEPAVIFGNLGYLVNLERDVDAQVGESRFGDVDPGDVIKASLGLGFALNEQTSVSFGYEHNYVLETDSEVILDDGSKTTVESDALQVGRFFIGGAYALNDWVSINSTLQIGVTDDAPDGQITVRVPIRFNLLDSLKSLGSDD